MSNHRIAVVFAGQPRTFRRCYESHLDFFKLDGYDFDFFIHAWSDQWWSPKTNSEHTVTNAFIENPDELKDELIKIYNPKSIYVERQRECESLIGDMESLIRLQKATDNQMWHSKNESYTNGAWGRNHDVGRWLDGIHAGQVYSWQQATNLKIDYEKENNFQYDAVIKFRLDNILDVHHDGKRKDIFQKACTPRMKFQWQHVQPNGFWTVGDMFFCGQTEQFNLLMKNIYTFLLRDYCRVLGNTNGEWHHAGCPEAILSKKLVHEKIPTHEVNVSHIPYREYHLDLDDQSYKNLCKARGQVHERGVNK